MPDELQSLLAATSTLSTPHSRLQAVTYRTLLLILYGALLRVSEALKLQLGDVDLEQRILTVRNTKFYKSRLVPIGPRLTLELANYVEQRGALALPEGRDSALLCSRTGHRLTYQSPDTVRAFLEYVEHERGCGVVTRNQRLSAIHSLARFIGTRSPEHLAWCTEVRSIPFKKAAKTVIGYLEKLEMEALLRAPDQRTCLGARDHVLLLFL